MFIKETTRATPRSVWLRTRTCVSPAQASASTPPVRARTAGSRSPAISPTARRKRSAVASRATLAPAAAVRLPPVPVRHRWSRRRQCCRVHWPRSQSGLGTINGSSDLARRTEPGPRRPRAWERQGSERVRGRSSVRGRSARRDSLRVAAKLRRRGTQLSARPFRRPRGRARRCLSSPGRLRG